MREEKENRVDLLWMFEEMPLAWITELPILADNLCDSRASPENETVPVAADTGLIRSETVKLHPASVKEPFHEIFSGEPPGESPVTDA
jgi:hypothetical protein